MGFDACGVFEYACNPFFGVGWAVQAWMINLVVVGGAISIVAMVKPGLLKSQGLLEAGEYKEGNDGKEYTETGAPVPAGGGRIIKDPNTFTWGIRNLACVLVLVYAMLFGGKGAYATALAVQLTRETLDLVQNLVVIPNMKNFLMFFPMWVLDLICLIAVCDNWDSVTAEDLAAELSSGSVSISLTR